MRFLAAALACAITLAAASMAWAESDGSGKIERVQGLLKERSSAGSAWRTEEIDVSAGGWRAVEGLALCTGIFLVGVHFYKRYAGKPKNGRQQRIVVLERCSIAPKTSLVLVQHNGAEVLLAVGSDRVTCVHQTGGAAEFRESLEELCKEDVTRYSA